MPDHNAVMKALREQREEQERRHEELLARLRNTRPLTPSQVWRTIEHGYEQTAEERRRRDEGK
jgi:hypothetical protein